MKFEQFNNDYTGEQFEEELVPEIDSGWDGKKWIEKSSEDKKVIIQEWIHEHLPQVNDWDWKRASPDERREILLDWAKNNQPENWNPSNPVFLKESEPGEEQEAGVNNKIVANLHTSVADALGLENYDDLRFYSSLHSPADTLYGIDGFFELGDMKFTVDFTVNKSKIESGVGIDKADWVMTLNDPDDEREIAEQAKRIARSFKLKIQMAERRKQQAA